MKQAVLITLAAIGCITGAQASYIQAYITTPGFNGPEFAAGTDPITRTGPGYVAKAQTLYGVNKGYAQSNVSEFQFIQTYSDWSVNFDLSGAAPGTPVVLTLTVAYDYNLSLGAIYSAATFNIEINHNHFNPYYSNTTSHPFDVEGCFDIPGRRNFGECSGAHSGSITQPLNYTIGPNQSISVLAQTGAIATATADAFSTARVTGIEVPNGITWNYTDLPGNPLNFHYAAASAVPEPGSAVLLGGGLLSLVAWKRRAATRKR